MVDIDRSNEYRLYSNGFTARRCRKNVQGGHEAFVHFIGRDVAKVPWNDRIENVDIKVLVDAVDAGGAKFFLFILTH